ncbi:MAG: hypothetical protein WBD16_15735 [Pyrinomonadaceae bacterium]
MRYSIIALLLHAFFPLFATAQDENVRGAIQTQTGLFIIWNEPNNNFTIEVTGKVVERIPNKNLAFLIDGKFLQIVTAFKKDFLSDKQKEQKLDEKSILSAHLSWESTYLEKTIGEKLEINSEAITLSNSKNAVLWSFLVPKKDQGEVKRQVFLTTVKDESVLVLNGAVTSKVGEDAVRQFLLQTATTLTIRSKPLTLNEAKELASKMN